MKVLDDRGAAPGRLMSSSVFLPFRFMAGCFAAVRARMEKLSSDNSSTHLRNRPPWSGPRDRQADACAKELLLRMLSPDQRAHYESHGSFMVSVPGRGTFCILPRTAFNVVHARTGDAYCCICERPVPLPDLMLAQKLMLELEPEWFFSIANRMAACDFVRPGLDFSAQTREAAGGSDRRQPRVRCSMLSMIPHVGYLL
jgi:hypothetical protein